MAVVRPRPLARPAVRLRAVPPLDPPFDDELPGASWPVGLAGQLLLPISAPPKPPGGRAVKRTWPARPLPAMPGATDASDGADAAVRGGAVTGGTADASALPPEALATASAEARQAAHRFLGTCLEIFNGYRPAAHVRPLAGGAEAMVITDHLVATTRRLADRRLRRPGGRPPGPATAADLLRLRRLRVCEPRPGIAEAAAVLTAGGRCWAMAFRLERRRGNWLGTVARVL